MREGDYLVGIAEVDVKWNTHAEVVASIKAAGNGLKLRLVTPLNRSKSNYNNNNNNKTKVKKLWTKENSKIFAHIAFPCLENFCVSYINIYSFFLFNPIVNFSSMAVSPRPLRRPRPPGCPLRGPPTRPTAPGTHRPCRRPGPPGAATSSISPSSRRPRSGNPTETSSLKKMLLLDKVTNFHRKKYKHCPRIKTLNKTEAKRTCSQVKNASK